MHQFASPQTNDVLLTLLRERAPALILGLGQYFSVSVSLPWTMMEVFDAHAATPGAMACLVATSCTWQSVTASTSRPFHTTRLQSVFWQTAYDLLQLVSRKKWTLTNLTYTICCGKQAIIILAVEHLSPMVSVHIKSLMWSLWLAKNPQKYFVP